MPVVVFDAVDVGPPELVGQLPFRAELLRVLPGPDRPDHALAVCEQALRWRPAPEVLPRTDPADRLPDGDVRVHALVLAPRLVGDRLGPDLRDLWVGVAHVLDPTQLRDPALDLATCHYAAVARIDLDPTTDHLPQGCRPYTNAAVDHRDLRLPARRRPIACGYSSRAERRPIRLSSCCGVSPSCAAAAGSSSADSCSRP